MTKKTTKKPLTKKEGYSFDPKGHVHTLDGRALMGVTTVLSVISKPALIQWAANMACDYVDQARQSEKFTLEDLGNALKEARTAHRKKKEKAGDWGTKVHECIESTVKVLIEENEGYCYEVVLEAINETAKTSELDATQKQVIKKFFEWAVENEVTFRESEKNLYSRTMRTGGIVDLVFEMGGKKYIGDIKTSSGIYPEMFAQMGAYDLMLREMGFDSFDGYLIINLKKDGKIDFALTEHMELNRDFFKAALELYKIKQIVDGSVVTKNS